MNQFKKAVQTLGLTRAVQFFLRANIAAEKIAAFIRELIPHWEICEDNIKLFTRASSTLPQVVKEALLEMVEISAGKKKREKRETPWHALVSALIWLETADERLKQRELRNARTSTTLWRDWLIETAGYRDFWTKHPAGIKSFFDSEILRSNLYFANLWAAALDQIEKAYYAATSAEEIITISRDLFYSIEPFSRGREDGGRDKKVLNPDEAHRIVKAIGSCAPDPESTLIHYELLDAAKESCGLSNRNPFRQQVYNLLSEAMNGLIQNLIEQSDEWTMNQINIILKRNTLPHSLWIHLENCRIQLDPQHSDEQLDKLSLSELIELAPQHEHLKHRAYKIARTKISNLDEARFYAQASGNAVGDLLIKYCPELATESEYWKEIWRWYHHDCPDPIERAYQLTVATDANIICDLLIEHIGGDFWPDKLEKVAESVITKQAVTRMLEQPEKILEKSWSLFIVLLGIHAESPDPLLINYIKMRFSTAELEDADIDRISHTVLMDQTSPSVREALFTVLRRQGYLI